MRISLTIILAGFLTCSQASGEDAPASIFFKAAAEPETLEDAPASTAFGALAFDFSQATESAYGFIQEVHSTFDLGQKQMTQDISGSGRLTVRSDGMGMGEIALREVMIKNQKLPEPVQAPPLVITHVRPDGTTANAGNALAEVILLLLPMTGTDIVLGQGVKKPRRFPVHFGNQASEAVGERTITAMRHVLYQEKPCILFTVEDALLQLVPPIADTTVDMRGAGYFLFDYQAKAIVVSKFALRIRLLHLGEAKIDSDNFYSVARQGNPDQR